MGPDTKQPPRVGSRPGPELVAAAGALLAGGSAWLAAMAWDPIVNGHPSYPTLYSLTFLSGLSVTVVALTRRRPSTTLPTIGLVLVLVVLGVAVWWMQPFGAEEVALDAMEAGDGVSVDQFSDSIVMTPIFGGDSPGVIFYPGARVDARAYASILRPLAEDGHQVVIPKVPLGIAFLASGFAEDWARSNPDKAWVAAGHSLGGVVAADAFDAVDGLLLWASFPATDISGADRLAVTSIYGTADAIADPQDILDSASDLPEQSHFVAVEGAIHSYFGDYGLQPGDGTPGVDRSEAQAEIVAASLELINRVAENG